MTDLQATATTITATARTTSGGTRFVVTASTDSCGVEVFARTLSDALRASDGGRHGGLLALTGRWSDIPQLIAELRRTRHLVFNLPLVAWKRMLIAPLLLLLTARLSGRRVTLMLHEWAAMHRLRRIVLLPFLWFSHRIVLLSPYIESEIAADPLTRPMTRKVWLMPHPPTVMRPDTLRVTDLVRRVEAAAERRDVVIGYFGSLYRGKAPDALLDVAERLRDRGVNALVVFAGSFIRSLGDFESKFRADVTARGLDDHVVVTGYIGELDELYAVFERIGVFLFMYPEGLTARRSSTIACLQSNRPVVVSAPNSAGEFAHHAGFRGVIESGRLSFVPRGAGVAEITEAVLAAAAQRPGKCDFDSGAWWDATIRSANAAL